jgi:hypothetical protein
MHDSFSKNVVDAIAGAKVKTGFRNAIAYWTNISKISVFHFVDLDANPISVLFVEGEEPLLDRDLIIISVTSLQIIRRGWQYSRGTKV